MYDIIKSVILTGNYELSDMLLKINTNWVQDYITEEQKNELITLAREHALPENSYAPLQEQIDEVFNLIGELKETIKDLNDRVLVLEGEEPEEPPVEDEYPEYVQPTGAHDAYNEGDKIICLNHHK